MLAEFRRFAGAVCAFLAAAGVSTASAQGSGSRSSAGRTVWDGVYTTAQAARGKAAYEGRCRACHRDGPRKEDAFMRDWNGSDVERLFERIKTSMPAGAPSSLSDNE